MPDYTHLKLYDQFVALIDIKFHASNQFCTVSICFLYKILKASYSLPGHYDQTHLNLHNQFITLIDMKLHALKLYMSLYF